MKYIKTQKDVLLWPQEQVKALSHDRMVLTHNHVALGYCLKPRWDEVARYQLRASALMSYESVMRIRRFCTSEVPLTQSGELELLDELENRDQKTWRKLAHLARWT